MQFGDGDVLLAEDTTDKACGRTLLHVSALGCVVIAASWLSVLPCSSCSIITADRVNATGKGHKSRDIGNKASKNISVKLRWMLPLQNHNAEQAV